MKRFYLLTALFALTAAGCSKDDSNSPPLPENLTVEQTEYTLGAFENRTAAVSISAVADWTLSVVYDNAEAGDETGDDAEAAWLTADAAGGAAGQQSVQLTARLNFGVEPRTAYVDLVCGEQSVRLTVTQTGLSDDMDFTDRFDPAFAQVLQGLGHISDAEKITLQDMAKIAEVSELDVNSQSLTSLRGIEYFEALTKLECGFNQLTTLDVSKNTALTVLYCNSNELTTLDVSKNTALTFLSCYYNQLTTLDVSQNTALTVLWCYSNSLTTLDVSQNTALTVLWCHSNSLTTLDVSRNTALTELNCANNELTSLDVSQNTALTELECNFNQLTSLDVSQNTALTELECFYNQLTSLDVSQNTKLTQLLCEYNQLKELDVSLNTELTELWCNNNQLKELDVSLNTELTTLYCHSNQLTKLDISQNTELTKLYCDDNQLKELDISRNTKLTYLSCENNPGDGNSGFPLTVWGDQAEKPGSLYVYQSGWWYNGKYITIEYQTAE